MKYFTHAHIFISVAWTTRSCLGSDEPWTPSSIMLSLSMALLSECYNCRTWVLTRLHVFFLMDEEVYVITLMISLSALGRY